MAATAQQPELFGNRGSLLGIESGDRFIQQYQLWLTNGGAGQLNPFFITISQNSSGPVGFFGQTETIKGSHCP